MGTGISGAIPLDFFIDWESDREQIAKRNSRFFDFYRETKRKQGRIYYTLDYPDFLASFKDFYFGFHGILGTEDREKSTKFDDQYDQIVRNSDLEAFCEHFENGSFGDPSFIAASPQHTITGFSVVDMYPFRYLVIYHGSYQAYLEEYSTLTDMEKLLQKAYDHPLSYITKFGIFG